MKSKHLGEDIPSDPSTMLSKYFSYGDLTSTSTGIDNTPDAEQYNNIKWLASTLDDMYEQIGPFKVLSAFRTQDVQDSLGESGLPVGTSGAKGTTRSFHVAGLALDFAPISMDITEYFGKILASDWKNKLGEIFLKPTQNTIHVSMATPKYQGYAKVLNAAGTYVKLTEDEIAEYAKPFMAYIAEAASEVASAVGEATKSPINKGIILAAAAGLIFLLMGKKKARA